LLEGAEARRTISYEVALDKLARELARVREDERQRIAERLHDDFCQDLLVAKMRLAQLSENLSAEHGGSVEEINEILGDLLERTRTVMQDFYPQELWGKGLKAALRLLVKDLQRKNGISCTTNLRLLPSHFEERTQRILLRAVRELLCNVAKHARASHVKIAALRKSGWVVVQVSDNGEGFDGESPAVSNLSVGRFGLFSVRADLASCGGYLRLDSRRNKGTTAIVALPTETPSEKL
jgi:signal transduction histidine kinase